MSKIIDAKIKGLNINKENNTPTPATYASTVGDNPDAKVSNLRSILTAQRNEELAEKSAQKLREKNIIMHGLAESDENLDQQYIEKFIEDLELTTPIIAAKVERIGKGERGKNRPIKIILGSVEEKKKVFQSLKNLKGKSTYRSIHISEDYTLTERKLIRDFNEQAKVKTAQEADSNIIYRVRGSPKNGLFIKKFIRTPQTQA